MMASHQVSLIESQPDLLQLIAESGHPSENILATCHRVHEPERTMPELHQMIDRLAQAHRPIRLQRVDPAARHRQTDLDDGKCP